MKYYIRLDDICEFQCIEKWDRIEAILDEHCIKPLVGIIPKCEDPELTKYSVRENYWEQVNRWRSKGWVMALHGYNHLYKTKSGGINPIHNRSEFAGVPLHEQRRMIKNGVSILSDHGITPKVFFAPSHTFDKNTIRALKYESGITIISDTIAFRSYSMYGMSFYPQQIGHARNIPIGEITICYHPNLMSEKEFELLSSFLSKYSKRVKAFPTDSVVRKFSIADNMLQTIYFVYRRIKE